MVPRRPSPHMGGKRWRSTLLVLATGAGLLASVSVAATPANAAATTTALRSQLRAGTLTGSVVDICAGLRCRAQALGASSTSHRALATTQPVGYSPAELATAYHLPAPDVGRTGTIAVLETGAYPNLNADLAHYRSYYGLPACTTGNGCFKQVSLHGGYPYQPTTKDNLKVGEQAAAQEAALDVDMASASCPNCHILEVQVPLLDLYLTTPTTTFMNDFGTATATAVRLGASVVSVSFGSNTNRHGRVGQPARDLFHPGIPIVAASGDTGFEGGTHSGWPQDLPWVTSVGGTTLTVADQQGTAYDEVAWVRSGSGCETGFDAAYGQPARVSAHCDGHRASADISAVGDPQTGVAAYDTFHPAFSNPAWFVIGGTSAATPFIAGLYARGAHRSQTVGPNTLYAAAPTAFNDVVAGQNAATNQCERRSVAPVLCEAGPGWDGPTGLGTPRGLAAF